MKHKLSIALLIASSLALSSLPAFSQMQSNSVGGWLDHEVHKVEGTVKKVASPVIGFAGRTLQGEGTSGKIGFSGSVLPKNQFGKVGLAGGAAAGGGLTGGSSVCGMGEAQAMALLEAWMKDPNLRSKIGAYKANYCHQATTTDKSKKNTASCTKDSPSLSSIAKSIKSNPKKTATAIEITSNEVRCIIEAGMMEEDGE